MRHPDDAYSGPGNAAPPWLDASTLPATIYQSGSGLPQAAIDAAAIQHAEYRGFTDPEPEDVAIAEDMLAAARPHLDAAPAPGGACQQGGRHVTPESMAWLGAALLFQDVCGCGPEEAAAGATALMEALSSPPASKEADQ